MPMAGVAEELALAFKFEFTNGFFKRKLQKLMEGWSQGA